MSNLFTSKATEYVKSWVQCNGYASEISRMETVEVLKRWYWNKLHPTDPENFKKGARLVLWDEVLKWCKTAAVLVVFLALCSPAEAVTIKVTYKTYAPHVTKKAPLTQKGHVVPSSDTKANVGQNTASSMYAVIPNAKEREDIARHFAKKYGLNEETFICTLKKESGLNGWRPDGSLKCGDNGASCGIGQIQLPTWKSMRKHAGWSTEDLRGNDYENIKTTAYGMATYWPEHWTGYRLCKAEGYELFAKK